MSPVLYEIRNFGVRIEDDVLITGQWLLKR